MATDELPSPTLSSNAAAAALACRTERARAVEILALYPEIPREAVSAIADGTPVAAMKRRLTVAAQGSDPGSPSTAASKLAASAQASHPWGPVTARIREQQRAERKG